MPKSLVIVESPTKARKIAEYLGNDFVVESSVGHIRDLPSRAADVPAAFKGEKWASLGVDVDNDFKPLYVVNADKRSQVTKLKSLLKDASEVYLATDEDREGEAIAWHLMEVLSPQVPVKRMVFHEITQAAIREAVQNPRDLDRRLVDAQETRRILDRLVGWEVSEVLWKKVARGLSAGRVQSVATRMVVERERARMRFRAAGWWDLEGTFVKQADRNEPFAATLVGHEGKRVATGKDFDESGQLTADVKLFSEADVNGLAERLEGVDFAVRSVNERPYTSKPSAPFITSTLQQEAGRKLRFSSARTMQVAQRLYENGYITYMRTDSTTLSEQAMVAARSQAAELYGPEYVHDTPRRYERKVKNAQEAHEAIRPAGDTFRMPERVRNELGGDEFRLYELVWKRTVASQMADARGQSVQVRLGATSSSGEDVEFAASGRTITFPGYLRAYVEGADDPDAELEDREVYLPRLVEGDRLDATAMEPRGHETQPPARYTEASLVKALEDLGVGRPSTYASIISTIQSRGYVWKKGTALVPSFTAFAVVTLLEQHFGQLVDYGFTASMEDDLDEIAGGRGQSVPWLHRFYFGNGSPGLKSLVREHLDEIDARAVNSIHIGHTETDDEVVVRVGRYGPYVQIGDGEQRASIPDDLPPDELTVEKALELASADRSERVIGNDPDSGLPVIAKAGRFGPYVQVGEMEPGTKSKDKPRTASLFKTMSLETVTLDDALKLLSLPRVVGVDEDGEEITSQNGRYGPYLKKGSDSRSLETEDQLFDVTLEQAKAIFAQPKQRRGQRSAAALRELGPDPATERPMVIKDGRYGPYITDGEYNVTVPKGETVEGVTPERAAELLADKRAAGPPKAKKATKKATKARKTTKKTTKKRK
jgi:DNA topoisomerase I